MILQFIINAHQLNQEERGEQVRITIQGSPKEIAALVVALQERHVDADLESLASRVQREVNLQIEASQTFQ